MKSTFISACLTAVFALSGASMQAMAEADAVAAPAAATTTGAFSQAELDQMMAPVALYPDSLLSQILMAATYPDQVAQAAKWSKANPDKKGDDAVTAVQDQGWDPAVASLVAFPQVLDIMAEKPDWVKQMGDAFLAEPETVMNTVQSLRKKANEAGNLETTEQQKVVIEEAPDTTQRTIIKIESADPQVIYVPAYNPTVVYGTWWWPAYPPFYYYPPGYGIATAFWTGVAFGIGIGITNAIWGGCNWRRGDVNININKFNNINVNNRIKGKGNVSWKDRNTKRRDKARADRGNRKRSGDKLGGADKRKNFRGRDAQRDKARDTLKGKGIDPSKERKNLSGKGGDRVRKEVSKIGRSGKRGVGGDRPGDRGARDMDGKLGSGGLGDRKASGSTAKRDFSGASSKRSAHNALEGLGSSHRSGLSSDRGRSSNRSFERRGGGDGRGFGGGGFGGRGGGGGHFGGRR